MISSLVGTSLSGLLVSQRALETASNNISNVNTDGYSRQHVVQQTQVGGNGVQVVNVSRSYDQFVTAQVRSSTSAFSDVDAYHTLASEVDNMLADDSTSLSTAMKAFFDSVHGVANDPTSLPARQAMMSNADSMTSLLHTLNARFNEIRDQVNGNLDGMVTELNADAASVAKLNQSIVSAIAASGGKQMPNDLLDQRDQLLVKMSKVADLSLVPQDDGSVNVFIGNGQPLVVGKFPTALTVQASQFDPSHKSIMLNDYDISSQISGGELSGTLRFRDEILDPAQRQMGLVATGLATEFNKVHQTGVDLDGNPGQPFFDLGSPSVQVSGHAFDPALTVTATFATPTTAAPLASGYRLDILAGGTYNLTDLDSNAVVSSGALPPVTTMYGFDLSFMGTLNAGDQFQISPTFNVDQNIRVNPAIGSPRQIAAGATAGLPGDNSVALKLADLEKQALMQNGKTTFSQVYGSLVANVGNLTHEALVSSSAQQTLLQQATTSKENISGVNLDEEAANLIKFQQSYQAAAQSISMAKSLFDALMGAVR